MAADALRLALAPVVNRMRSVSHHHASRIQVAGPSLTTRSSAICHSVLGIISIPGMMTGAILGGASVEYAARLQMVIVFMISASTTLAAIGATGAALAVVVDGEHRIREDRVDGRPHFVYRAVEWGGERMVGAVKGVFTRRGKKDEGDSSESVEGDREEQERLLE